MTVTTHPVLGVAITHATPVPRPGFPTGVPAFLGRVDTPRRVDYGQAVGLADGLLSRAVRGFFANGGQSCYLVPLDEASATGPALSIVDSLADVDLVCAPELGADTGAPRAILRHCLARGELFAILDAPASTDPAEVLVHRDRLVDGLGAERSHGALYYPWLDGMPPCGAVAGVYARCDRRVGVHKAPANEPLEDAVDVAVALAHETVDALYAKGVNCLLSLPGRGIRVWGARTLSEDETWRDVTTRRVLSTLTRWIERFLTPLAFEPNGPELPLRIMRELGAYLEELFDRGALKGSVPAEAFFVRCDNETGSDRVVTHIGVALTRPAEFIDVRLMHLAGTDAGTDNAGVESDNGEPG